MFETERCIIRSFEEKDLDSFMTYRNNEAWMKYQSFKKKTKEEYRKALLVPLELEKGIQLVITDKTSDRLLGDLFLKKQENTISIGYSIDPIHARKGFITEVLAALLAKRNVYFPGCRIIAMTDEENIPSKKLLLKLGFEYEKWLEEWQTEVYVFTK